MSTKVKVFIITETISGLPECPKVFTDETAASACFVKIVRENFGQDYLAYCEQGGNLDPDKLENALSYTEESNTFGSIDLRFFETELELQLKDVG